MALRQVRPALQYSEGRSKPWSGARLVNAFSEKADGDKQGDFAVMASPGLDLLCTLPKSPVRGLHIMTSGLHAVAGDKLYRIVEDGLFIELGSIGGSGPVRMADNGAQLAIVGGYTGYVWTGSTLAQPADLLPVTDVAYIDGYFLWSLRDSAQVAYSAIGDGLEYDGLDVISAEGSPDGIIGIIANHRELLIFGNDSVEFFYNSGGIDNAFERQGNAFIERGAFDRDSICKVDNSVHFMGDDRIIYRLDGYSPVRISTHAIEYRIRATTTARAFAYTQEGHKFYCLATDDGTFCYDMATGAWHERLSFGRDNYRVGCSETAWSGPVMGDNVSGKLYRPNLDGITEDGEPIRVVIGLPTLEASRQRVTMYQFEAYFETGVGLNDGQGSDPQIMLRYSDDGGRTWSNEIWRSLGRIGEYRTRAIWRSLGQFRQRQMHLEITDPVRKFAIGYFADVR
jgi:hypothetical protein